MHAAFEVCGVDDLMAGHDHLKKAGYHAHWGVGRHILGSQTAAASAISRTCLKSNGACAARLSPADLRIDRSGAALAPRRADCGGPSRTAPRLFETRSLGGGLLCHMRAPSLQQRLGVSDPEHITVWAHQHRLAADLVQPSG
jgi:hypothetical protein